MALAALIVAVAAATVSLVSLVWTIGWSIYTHRRATRPAITVRGSWGLTLYHAGPGDEVISVTATNTGPVPVELTSAKVRIAGPVGQHRAVRVGAAGACAATTTTRPRQLLDRARASRQREADARQKHPWLQLVAYPAGRHRFRGSDVPATRTADMDDAFVTT
jgi:hypothetical protein